MRNNIYCEDVINEKCALLIFNEWEPTICCCELLGIQIGAGGVLSYSTHLNEMKGFQRQQNGRGPHECLVKY